jgi:hypothetical protein
MRRPSRRVLISSAVVLALVLALGAALGLATGVGRPAPKAQAVVADAAVITPVFDKAFSLCMEGPPDECLPHIPVMLSEIIPQGVVPLCEPWNVPTESGWDSCAAYNEIFSLGTDHIIVALERVATATDASPESKQAALRAEQFVHQIRALGDQANEMIKTGEIWQFRVKPIDVIETMDHDLGQLEAELVGAKDPQKLHNFIGSIWHQVRQAEYAGFWGDPELKGILITILSLTERAHRLVDEENWTDLDATVKDIRYQLENARQLVQVRTYKVPPLQIAIPSLMTWVFPWPAGPGWVHREPVEDVFQFQVPIWGAATLVKETKGIKVEVLRQVISWNPCVYHRYGLKPPVIIWQIRLRPAEFIKTITYHNVYNYERKAPELRKIVKKQIIHEDELLNFWWIFR